MGNRITFKELREEERENKKALLIDVAIELFEKRSFYKIGMRDIARKAGISAAAIYRYFPSRDDILVEAIVRNLDSVEKKLKKMVVEGNPSLEEIAIAGADYLLENQAISIMLGHFMLKETINSNAWERFALIQKFALEMIGDVLAKSGIKVPNQYYIHAIYASVIGIVMTYRNYPGRSLDEIRKHIHELCKLNSQIYIKHLTFLSQKDLSE